eukprot:CAMPEP_0175065262 /NCGR_PEP_ID=MMETSP0052_2-20121109/15820_1 /TAXON_ID=51329 ORGANISM="Polytomella parva, Strain SAG 63-3" /NCGR_SAMPLE_ID=MMETSP0052_2 /ASSEMBLY_ACC=CAM_ASM_000194 /LENGTH=673 /DNA_ID=CAMNT_0016331763 /DNA_START=185 /DNA_END=2202 /DNA_ORIENTATION=+
MDEYILPVNSNENDELTPEGVKNGENTIVADSQKENPEESLSEPLHPDILNPSNTEGPADFSEVISAGVPEVGNVAPKNGKVDTVDDRNEVEGSNNSTKYGRDSDKSDDGEKYASYNGGQNYGMDNDLMGVNDPSGPSQFINDDFNDSMITPTITTITNNPTSADPTIPFAAPLVIPDDLSLPNGRIFSIGESPNRESSYRQNFAHRVPGVSDLLVPINAGHTDPALRARKLLESNDAWVSQHQIVDARIMQKRWSRQNSLMTEGRKGGGGSGGGNGGGSGSEGGGLLTGGTSPLASSFFVNSSLSIPQGFTSPKMKLNTPYTLTLTSQPIDSTPNSKAERALWKTEWNSLDPKEVSASAIQVDAVSAAHLNLDRRQFQMAIKGERSLEEQKAFMEAQMARERQAARELRSKREEDRIELAAKLRATKTAELERKLYKRDVQGMERRAQWETTRATVVAAAAAANEAKLLCVRASRDEYDRRRHMGVIDDHLIQSRKRNARPSSVMTQAELRAQKSVSRFEAVQQRYKQSQDRRQLYNKQLLSSRMQANAATDLKRSELLKQRSLVVSRSLQERMASQTDSLSQHDQDRRRMEERLLNCHNEIARKLREKKEAEAAVERDIQEIRKAQLIGSYWTNELEMQSSWTKKPPAVRPELIKTVSSLTMRLNSSMSLS